MEYGKLVNGYIRHAPTTVVWNGRTVNNASPDKLQELGYLPITYTEPPDIAPDGQHYESSCEQTETEILQTWHLVEDIPYQEPEPPVEERLAEIEERQEVTD